MKKNKIMTFLLSLAVAFGLWTYVITVENPESDNTYHNIPVILMNEEALTQRGLMLTSDGNLEVDLHLSGNRKELNKLYPSDISITLDLSKIYGAGKHELAYSIGYPGDIPQGAFTVLSKNPSMITVTVERQVSKPVPVVVKYEGAVAEGYFADMENARLEVQTVNVTGPASAMENIKQAVVSVNIEGVTQTFSKGYSYMLCDENGEAAQITNPNLITTDVEEVVLTLDILQKKEVQLVMNVIEGAGATTENSTITIEPQFITVVGSQEALADLESLELGTIDLSVLTKDMEPTAYAIPEIPGVTNLTGITEAMVSVTFPNLMTTKFTVNQIVAVNVPAGMEAEVVTRQLEITVRGSRNLISKMTAEHLTVQVDLSNAQLGTYTARGVIHMAPGFEEVGALGIYNVTVTLKEPVEENTGETTEAGA